MKILVVMKNWLGDILFQGPALEKLREKYPEAEIVCMAPLRCHPILKAHPAVNRVLLFDEKKEHRFFLRRWLFMFTLGRERFDKVYLFHRSKTRALLAMFAGIRERIGYANDRKAFLTRSFEEPAGRMHQADYYTQLVCLAEGLEETRAPYHFYFSAAEETQANAQLQAEGLQTGRYVCFHLGANWEPKRWPICHFKKLADLIARKWNLPIVVTGRSDDRVLLDAMQAGLESARVISLIGKTTLGELASIFKNACWIVSADSGPMHIASGAGASVVALFGPTDPAWTGPHGIGKSVILSYVPEGYSVPWYSNQQPFPQDGWMSHILPESVILAIEQSGWMASSAKMRIENA